MEKIIKNAYWKRIVVHCSDSYFGNRALIDEWHKARGFDNGNGTHIGYHAVINNGWINPDFYIPSFDGMIELGRPINGDGLLDPGEMGAQAYGFNQNSLSICLISVPDKNKRIKDGVILKQITPKQWNSLIELCLDWQKRFNIPTLPDSAFKEGVIGHYEINPGKSCPGFNVTALREALKIMI